MRKENRCEEKLKSSNQVVKYQELYKSIKAKIDTKEWAENQVIPTERELAEVYDTSRTTVRKAIEHLRQQGYLHSEHGRGNFVLPELSRQSQRSLHSFTDDLVSRGGKPKQEILEIGFIPLNDMIRKSLELPVNERRIFCVKRVRYSNTTPMGIQTAYFPLKEKDEITQEALLECGSLYKLLGEKCNIFPLEAHESISARLPSATEARLLELSSEDVVLACSRITLGLNRKPMEYVEMVYPANRYSYQIKITKDSFNHK